MEVMNEAFDQVILGIKSAIDPVKKGRLIEINYRNAQNRIEVVDLDPIVDETGDKASARNLNCRPLGIMAIGASDKTPIGKSDSIGAPRHWSAAVNADQLSLSFGRLGDMVILDTSLMGHEASDFIFLYASAGYDLKRLVPENFRRQKTARGEMAWSYNVPGRELQQNLMAIGGALFGSSFP